MGLSDLLNDLYGDDKRKMSVESFDNLIQKLDMRPEYNIFLDNGDIIINEEWSSLHNSDIRANRIYKFNLDFINMILLEDRPRILSRILNIYVDQENYEEASVLRDIIKEFNY